MNNSLTNDSCETFIHLLTELCEIPSQTGFERARAEFCTAYLKKLGYDDVLIDEADNVILPVNIQNDMNNTAFMAHLDTVFDNRDDFTVRESDGRLYAPGIGDNTANAAGLLLLAKYIAEQMPKLSRGYYLVWSSGEEGLGNLRGSRAFIEKYRDRISDFIALDLYYNKIFTDCVGSVRYKITAHTAGGHSYLDFGSRNAIAELAKLIVEICGGAEFNTDGLTYNFGTIKGGTTVNTIAADAELFFEFRSQNAGKMKHADKTLKALIEERNAPECSLEISTLGLRPCSENVNTEAIERLAGIARAAIIKNGCPEPIPAAASTDCNIPLSLGIPSVCFGVCMGAGVHTKGEWIEKDSTAKGLAILVDFFAALNGE